MSSPSLLFAGLAAGLAFASAACSARAGLETAPAAQADTIFRYVSVGRNVPVVLGQPISDAAMPLLDRTGPRSYAVRPGQFSGAAAIGILVTEDGRARAFTFAYAPGDEGFEAKVDSYAESLGKPAMVTRAGERLARWQDAKTRFELIDRGGRVHGLLTDLRSPG